jgi:hypothetical protein
MLQRLNPLANRRQQIGKHREKIFNAFNRPSDVGNVCAGYTMTGMAGHILPMEALGHPALRFQRI